MSERHYPDHLSTCGVDFRGCDPKCPFDAAADEEFDSYARERLMCWHDGGLMCEIDDLLSDIKLARHNGPLPLKLIKAIRDTYPSALTKEETNRFFNKVELPANHLPTCGKTFPQRCAPGCPFAPVTTSYREVYDGATGETYHIESKSRLGL